MKSGFAPALCVLGTSTDVGKTFVTAGLLKALTALHVKTQAVKLVQTGCKLSATGELFAPDLEVYKAAVPSCACFALHKFAMPCSPHLAAIHEEAGAKGAEPAAAKVTSLVPTAANLITTDAQARNPISTNNTAENLISTEPTVGGLTESVWQKAEQAEVTLLEGAGGVMTPLNQQETFLDFVEAMAVPVVLVVANKLGSINHALLSLEALRQRGVEVLGVVFCYLQPPFDDKVQQVILSDNIKTVVELGKTTHLASVPYFAEVDISNGDFWEELASHFLPLAYRIKGRLHKEVDTATLPAFDKEHLWHPYTSATNPLPVWEAVKTRGANIYLRDGKVLIDGMASWWSTIHGYNHPRLLEALRLQAGLMPHVMFGGLTHAPAVKLAQKLLALVPANLQHVFFCDSGSVAVEVAIKMALQYQQAKGKKEKNTILAPYGAYHGDTLGAMSVCDPVNGMHNLFENVLPKQLFVQRPACAFHSEYNKDAIIEMENTIKSHAHKIAAVILEPIVQGAGGMWFYHPQYLHDVKRLCMEHDILLILDEIATGFGRTGKMFACEWAQVQPDIMCAGKALTGGVMSLAATLTTREVAHGISQNGGVLMHGPTFMGNALACAVACASLDLLVESPWVKQVQHMEATLQRGLGQCKGFAGVQDVRVLGGIGAVAMEKPVNVQRLQEYFVNRWGVWVRPFANLIYVMPPYNIKTQELDKIVMAIASAIEERIWE